MSRAPGAPGGDRCPGEPHTCEGKQENQNAVVLPEEQRLSQGRHTGRLGLWSGPPVLARVGSDPRFTSPPKQSHLWLTPQGCAISGVPLGGKPALGACVDRQLSRLPHVWLANVKGPGPGPQWRSQGAEWRGRERGGSVAGGEENVSWPEKIGSSACGSWVSPAGKSHRVGVAKTQGTKRCLAHI